MARRTVPRGNRVIDAVRWIGTAQSATALSAGTVAATVVAEAGDSPYTIMRLRGQLFADLDTTSAPGIMVDVGVGLHVVQAGTGTTVVQSPITNPDAKWFWYTRFALAYEEMVTDVIDVPGATSYRETIDGKAMRRVMTGQEVQIVFENLTVHAAGAVNVRFTTRMLQGR